MRPAAEADRTWIEDRCRRRLTGAMFPLANLRNHGWGGSHPRAVDFWLDEGRDLLLARTKEGMVMPVSVRPEPGAAATALGGCEAMGVIGPTEEVRPFLDASGLTGCPAKLDADEPQFELVLSEMVVPEGPGALAPLAEIDRAIAVDWRTAYLIETLGEPASKARATAEADIDRYVAADSHRALVVDGVPVAMTGINAALPEIVQIGGVWTPPELRGRGHARRAVALHLDEVRAGGVRSATLFASGLAAVRAYRSLGFSRIGSFSLVIFTASAVIAG
ncbi:MAG: GNAT family N-acetyltransferase [Paracoccaceae bacterium]|nr:GNAT family N-acetyltransferase [Paracoccaceae bacterium]